MADRSLVNRVQQELSELPADTDPSFEFKLTYWVQRGRRQDEDELTQEALRQIVEDREQPAELRFKAIYALHVWLRRRKEHTKLRELMETYGYDFKDRPLYPHLKA